MNITIVSAHKVAILPRIRSPDMEICSRYDHKKNTICIKQIQEDLWPTH